MAENPHYKELLQLLNDSKVEHLIVVGFAVMKYGLAPLHQRSRRVSPQFATKFTSCC
jgi:hypothetical protein